MDELTESQKVFCKEYILDWNATRAYLVAYPNTSNDAARSSSSRLLTNDNIKTFLSEIQKDLEKVAGVSRLRVIQEHMKLAFNSIAHLHNTWIERKDFEQLTDDQKACISEISTQIKQYYPKDADSYEVEFVKIKLYDKQKALDSISKMLGYDSPEQINVSGSLGQEIKVMYEGDAQELEKI